MPGARSSSTQAATSRDAFRRRDALIGGSMLTHARLCYVLREPLQGQCLISSSGCGRTGAAHPREAQGPTAAAASEPLPAGPRGPTVA